MEDGETLVEFVCTRCGAQGLALAEGAAGRVGALRPLYAAAAPQPQVSRTPHDGALQMATAPASDGSEPVRLGVPRCPDCGERLRAYKVRLRPIRLPAVG